MIISHIVAVDKDWGIGFKNQLPWHLPEDLKNFKRITSGNPILMGRNTYESIGKPLPNRLNIVISSKNNTEFPEGVLVFKSIDEAVSYVKSLDAKELFIIGGSMIFNSTLLSINKLYLTKIDHSFNVDTYYNPINFNNWICTSSKIFEQSETNQYPFTFEVWEKV